MNFEYLLNLIGEEPVFETSLLLAGDVNPDIVRMQLARWTKSCRIYQLRRGLYTLAPPYQKVKPHPFLIANHMQHASYVSGQSALAFWRLIPETIQSTLSVTTGRPEHLETSLGVFDFQHIKLTLLRGYRMINLQGPAHPPQQALVATPEKALLDLVYLQPGGDSPAYLQSLRLQNMEQLDLNKLNFQAEFFHSPKMNRAVQNIIHLAEQEIQEFEAL